GPGAAASGTETPAGCARLSRKARPWPGSGRPPRRRGTPRQDSRSMDKPPFFKQLRELLDMIKFEHTVLALPVAFLGALAGVRGLPPAVKVFWILLAMGAPGPRP